MSEDLRNELSTLWDEYTLSLRVLDTILIITVCALYYMFNHASFIIIIDIFVNVTPTL